MIQTGEKEELGEKHYIVCLAGERMGMEKLWNDTYKVKTSAGRKTLYSVGDRRMNGNGALVELY